MSPPAPLIRPKPSFRCPLCKRELEMKVMVRVSGRVYVEARCPKHGTMQNKGVLHGWQG